MSKLMRQPFTPGGKFVASKDFRFHGKSYTTGDEFPWRKLSCSVRKLRTLYEGRLLNNDYIDPEVDAVEEVAEVVEEVTEEVDEIPELTVYDPDLHEIVNPDRGEWYLDLDGKHMLRLEASEAKRLRKKMRPVDINPMMVIEE